LVLEVEDGTMTGEVLRVERRKVRRVEISEGLVA
jgi:hypothetical protein